MKKISVGIVDVHPVHAEGVKEFLTRTERFNIVAMGQSLLDISNICCREQPDILITEIAMKGDPYTEIHGASSHGFGTKIIILTDIRHQEALNRALAGRARGYVLKDRADTDLVQAMDFALNDSIYLSPPMASLIFTLTNKYSVRYFCSI